jgi:endonuclease I
MKEWSTEKLLYNRSIGGSRYINSAILFLWLTVCTGALVVAQPAGYYTPAEGKQGEALQQALHAIIDDHTVLSYSELWTAFRSTDKRADGTVWDMYSDRPGGPPPYIFYFGSDQCGNYSGESSCYNREHSFPKSWFNDDSPMNTDLFHIYPTDGYVNGKRSNYPFGETDSPSWTSQNGSEVGPSSVDGYTGTVFEPIDEYKGDFARTYFYMAVRYYGEDSNWPGSPMVNGAQLEPWALEMMLAWHEQDTVSDKEIARNKAVYALQGNRNPFIDGDIIVVSAGFSNEHNTRIDLTTSGFQNGDYIITISGVSDTSGNKMQLAFYSLTVNLLNIPSALVSNSILLFPNPTTGNLTVSFDNELAGYQIQVRDELGRVSHTQSDLSGLSTLVDLSGLAPGIYYIEVKLEDSSPIYRKIILH